jgi:hypothetical protein
MARHYGKFSRLCCIEGFIAEQQAEAPFLSYATVTRQAVFIENGFDLTAIVDLLLRRSKINDEKRDRRCKDNEVDSSSQINGNNGVL